MTEATFTAWACGCTATTTGMTTDECPHHDSPTRDVQIVHVTPWEVDYGHRCAL